jgi:hypothetical protein
VESVRSHIIAVIHGDLAFLLALAVSLAKREIGVVPSSSCRELDTLLQELQLEPETLIIDGRIAGVCRYAAVLQSRWPDLTVFVTISDHPTCNYCKRFLQVFAKEGNLLETVSSLVQEIAVTKSVQAKGTGRARKRRRRGVKKHSEGGAT